MRLQKMSLTSFGPFEDLDNLSFAPGINLIVGKNNVGKSFLLKAIRPGMDQNPFRSPTNFRVERLQPSSQNLIVEVSGRELETEALLRGGQETIPVPRSEIRNGDFFQTFFSKVAINVKLRRRAGSAFEGEGFPASVWGAVDPIEQSHRIHMSMDQRGFIDVQGQTDTTPILVWHMWQKKVFYFSPQRNAEATAGFGRQTVLNETASNLASVLSWMRGERDDLFRKIVSDMREIFDTIGNISVTNTESGFEIRIWPTIEMVHAELSSSLAACGTGLGQALAILTAASTADNSIIVIDEINTFLHPGAAKALLRILQSDYAEHQYIVSTHSAEVIGTGIAATVSFVTREDHRAVATPLSRKKIEDLQVVATSLGVSASDVFMHQKVIWVEGPTEEGCFDLIRRHKFDEPQEAMRFVSVASTGDFFSKKRDRELVLEIYRKLTTTMSPVTPKPLFCFDREGLSEQDVQDIRRRSKFQMHFIDRRNIEAFLLVPSAISALLRRDFPDRSDEFAEEKVQERLIELGGQKAYMASAQWTGDLSDRNWLGIVDGAALLRDVFREISGRTIEYVKTKDSISILSILLDREDPAIQPLIDTVLNLELKLSRNDT